MPSPQTIIYFLCPDWANPVGGIKVIYKHVDILNAHGFAARVVHSKKNFRMRWFDNHTEVVNIRSVCFHKHDVVVIPEFMASHFFLNRQMHPWKLKLKKIFSKNRLRYHISEIAALPVSKVIFNQNSYATFHNYPFIRHTWDVPYLRPDVVQTIVVSEDNANYLRHTFPSHKVERIHVSFDTSLFNYSSGKKSQICFMPRKNSDDARQVVNILQAKKLLDGFELVVIDGKPTREVAQILKESLIFMSFGYPEGSPLPPCEAMLCGCVVVGYHGWGGREYFKPEFCYPVEVGDVVQFARQMETAIQLHRTNPELLVEQGRMASEFIQDYFHAEVERQDVLRVWTSITNQAEIGRLEETSVTVDD